jgi:hypothetical protein
MAASFNRSSWFLKGDVVSTDLRVLNNRGGNDIGLTGFGEYILVARCSLITGAHVGIGARTWRQKCATFCAAAMNLPVFA